MPARALALDFPRQADAGLIEPSAVAHEARRGSARRGGVGRRRGRDVRELTAHGRDRREEALVVAREPTGRLELVEPVAKPSRRA